MPQAPEKISTVLHEQQILILDFGSQYTQNIARRVREAQVFCEIYPYTKSIDEVETLRPNGIILSGGPASVLEKDAILCGKVLRKLVWLGNQRVANDPLFPFNSSRWFGTNVVDYSIDSLDFVDDSV